MTSQDSIERSTRRHFLAESAMRSGPALLACLIAQRAQAEPKKPPIGRVGFDLKAKYPPLRASATAMISLFMQGGPSQVDLLDPKPLLNKLHLQKFPGKIKYDNAAEASSKVFGSPWKFKQYGEHGTDVSELLPHFATIADEALVIRSMHTGVNNHGQSIHAMNSGRTQKGRPALGSWLTYALGAESESLPAYIAMTDPKGLPVEGVLNWSNGWLPSLYQGTVIRSVEPRILNLQPPPELSGEIQANYLEMLAGLNRRHAEKHPGEHELQARIANFELAERMQFSAEEATDLSRESRATHRMYGIDQPETKEFGERCLIARRLIERGVRFVQLFTKNQYWDHHGGIVKSLPVACRKVDQPAAALVKDLKQRGMLDSTVVHWGGEMGRLPVIQNEANIGRDHNTDGFSMWVAGGGFRSGIYGQTDEFGHHAVEDVVNHFDYHATLLRLFGIDAEQLTFAQNGREQTLIDGQPAKVIPGLLA
ncbi:DUF1501 domain-containing protein [Aureliella helgolandensis]|uniref:Sulfatase n=1 Tax=Aureliella helgolandensis TaxID=2527968 RepID=A0A518G932_9BACT|nr:DUF1501 domain-containing protein [Aureliella helgolandensis]QDV25108.1 hypothetical protein Q31a_34310 [Aureliella helgolandensis]